MAVADPGHRSGKTAGWLRRAARRPDAFDWLSLGLMAGLLALALFYWHNYPVHMDTYYHMGVTSGFSSAGGVALHSFWEFAPGGRPHLYPPLLHIIMFAVSGGGVSILGAGRIVSFFAFPLMLLTNWYAMRRLFSTRAAFYTLVLLSSCYLLFWHSAVESAASRPDTDAARLRRAREEQEGRRRVAPRPRSLQPPDAGPPRRPRPVHLRPSPPADVHRYPRGPHRGIPAVASVGDSHICVTALLWAFRARWPAASLYTC